VAFTYNDPVIFLEYAVDVAQACHDLGLNAVDPLHYDGWDGALAALTAD
jgi:hypothetical protein